MYQEADICNAVQAQRKSLLVYLLVTLVFLALIILSFVLRQKILTMALTIFLGSFSIFYLSFFFLPKYHYKKLLLLMQGGRKRQVEGLLKAIGRDIIERDHMECREITLKTGEDRHGDDELTLYLDNKKEIPFKEGDALSLTLFDRFICDYQIH